MMQKGHYFYDPMAHPHWTHSAQPTIAGLSGFGATRQMAPQPAPSKGLTFVQLLAAFKAETKKMTDAVVADLGGMNIVFSWGAQTSAKEWASYVNGQVASTIATLTKVTGDGQVFWARFPAKAKELLMIAQADIKKEASQYTKAAAYLLTIESTLRQATNVVVEEAATVVTKAVDAGLKGAMKGGSLGFIVLLGLAGFWAYGQVK